MGSHPIADYLTFYRLEVVPAGILPEPMVLVDLDDVQPSELRANVQNVVKEIQSSKVRFAGADIVLPKLRPYLGKALPNPPQAAIGSSEWIGVRCHDVDPIAMAVFLNSAVMCETMRFLQSGKQHPRVSIDELNSLHLNRELSCIDLDRLYSDLASMEKGLQEIDAVLCQIFDTVRASRSDGGYHLCDFFEHKNLNVVSKGVFKQEKMLIDLDAVKSVNYIDGKSVQTTRKIGSDKVDISDVDIIFSKLEPYLGKIASVLPNQSIGSTEWIGLSCKGELSRLVGSYALALPELRAAYRMLQSGKRHARIEVTEMLELTIPYNLHAVNSRKIKLLDRRLNSIRVSVRSTRNTLKQFSY